MTLLAPVKPQPICNQIDFLLPTDPQSVRGLQVRPQDLGFEISEDELAGELREHPAGVLPDQTIPEFDPDQFEIVYRWFLT